MRCFPSDTCWKGLVPVVDSINCKQCTMICRPGNIDLLLMRPAADVEMTSVAPIATSAGLSVAKRPLQFCSLVGTHWTTENQHQIVQNKFHVDLGAKKEVGSVCHNGYLTCNFLGKLVFQGWVPRLTWSQPGACLARKPRIL